jgi:hypothetical protein
VPDWQAPAHLDDGGWFHGSPRVLDVLATGSTVTRSRVVAEAFSHKPTCVGLSEEAGGGLGVCHNGRTPGYLYVLEDEVTEDDVFPHPRSAYKPGGMEWLTKRPLRLRLICPLPASQPRCPPDCPHKPQPPGIPASGE